MVWICSSFPLHTYCGCHENLCMLGFIFCFSVFSLAFWGLVSLFLLLRLEDLERTHQSLVNTHHGPGVVELSAVVRGREDSHQSSLGEELVPILHNLDTQRATHTHTQRERERESAQVSINITLCRLTKHRHIPYINHRLTCT